MERSIEVISTPGCGQCTATKLALKSAGIEYEERDATVDTAAADEVKQLGYFSAPVVLVKIGGQLVTHWGGFRPDNVRILAASGREAEASGVFGQQRGERAADVHADDAREALDRVRSAAATAGVSRSI